MCNVWELERRSKSQVLQLPETKGLLMSKKQKGVRMDQKIMRLQASSRGDTRELLQSAGPARGGPHGRLRRNQWRLPMNMLPGRVLLTSFATTLLFLAALAAGGHRAAAQI